MVKVRLESLKTRQVDNGARSGTIPGTGLFADSSPAKQRILDAVRNGSYKTAVAGHDKVTNDFKIIGLSFE